MIPSHNLIQKFRKSSDVFQRAMKPATSAAIAATISPMGFAAMTAFIATMMPCPAFITVKKVWNPWTSAVITETILNAASPAPMDAMIGTSVGRTFTRSPTNGMIVVSPFTTAVITFSIAGPFSFRNLSMSSAAVTFRF